MNSEIRKLFPATEKLVYLNSAAVSPLPVPSVLAVERQLQDVSLNGSTNYPKWVETKNRCRILVSELLNIKKEAIAFLRNTSDGFASVANGMTWRPGDNIVSFAGEFPSNFYPWRMVRDRHGVELRLCSEKHGSVDIDEMISSIDSRTRIVSISAVQFHNGFRSDLERIGEAARRNGALFAVDIIQAFGSIPLDLSSAGVDIAAGASHKWLCAPEGCGILFLSDKALAEIQPSLVGWISVPEPWNFDHREQGFHPNSLALESGTGPSALFYGLEQSLLLLREIGIEKIKEHNFALADRLCHGLVKSNFDVVSARSENCKSQIVAIRHRSGKSPTDIFKSLQESGVIISARGDMARISPHLFNNDDDIDRAVSLLEEF
jgi:cysteine desulfurase / selenocysteine lyase